MFGHENAGTWGEAAITSEQPFARVHEQFQARFSEVWPSAQAEQAVAAAYANYIATLQEPWASSDLGQRVAAQYAECVGRLREAFAGPAGERAMDSYRDYVRELKQAWASLDADALTPQELGALAQGMTWVAGLAVEISAARVETFDTGSHS